MRKNDMRTWIQIIATALLMLAVGWTAGCSRSEDGSAPDTEADRPTTSAPKPEDSSRTPSERAATTDEKIRWYDYNEGLELGKNQNRKVFINFYADWCGYCKQMDRETFQDRAVIAYLNEEFVPVRVDTEQNQKAAADYRVRGLPVSWFIAEDGEPIGSQPGYIPPDTLLSLLRYIGTDSYKTMKFTEFAGRM